MRIGKIGEKIFESLATQGGFVCNKPDEDIFGWDYIIEINNTPFNNSTPDKSEPNICCYIQVKTTKSNISKTKIKLSNWLHMVKTPNPTFILYIQLNKENFPIKTCLSHLDEELMNKALRKLRESKDLKLNQHYMYHNPKESDYIDNITGFKLKEKIINYIDNDYHAYCKRKMQLNEVLGYDKDRIKGKFKINKSIEDIVDFSLGIREKLEVNNLVIEEDVRYGIPGKIIKSDVGYIEANPISKPIQIIIESDAKEICEKFDGKIILPFNFIKSIPKENLKFRVESTIGNIDICSDMSFMFNIRIDFNKKEQTLSTLLPFTRLFLLIGHNTKDIKLSVVFEGMTIFSFNLPYNFINEIKVDNTILRFCDTLENLNKVISFFDEDKNIHLNINEISKNECTIAEMRSFVDVLTHDNLFMGFTVNEGLDQKRCIAIPRILSIEYSGKYLLIAGVYFGEIIYEQDDGSYKAKIKPSLSMKKKIKNLAEIDEDMLFEKLSRENKENYVVIDFRQNET